MSDLIVVAFDDETTAFDLRAELAKLQSEYLIEMEDVVVVTRNTEGKVRLHQAVDLTLAGAASGSFWGLLVGLLFLNPLLGVAVGAGSGALAGALSDTGINDGFIKEVGEKLKPGSSAVFVLVRKMTADKVMERLSAYAGKGHVLQTSLTGEQEAKLRDLIEKAPAVTPPPAPAA
ncbi:MAG: DUF1269 domain-containing protein [Paracoccaceae bacterium]